MSRRKKARLVSVNDLEISSSSFRGLTLAPIVPLTHNQRLAFQSYRSGKNVFLTGSAGTGKTFILLSLMLETLFTDERYEKIIVVRSSVPTREIGYLPGNVKEKLDPYETAYKRLVCEILESPGAFDVLGKKNFDVICTSFVRGTTLENCLVLVDEASNLTFHELDSVITRVGKNCRIFFAGDESQSDLRFHERTGYRDFLNIVKTMDSFEVIRFETGDIVRSGLVREYLLRKEEFSFA